MTALADRIAVNLARVRERIATACAEAGRDPQAVNLIAVTKNQSPDVLPILRDLGVTDVGENRLEHLAMMREAAPEGLRWHAIGRVQGRQFRDLIPMIDCLHSLHDVRHVSRLATACRRARRCLPVYCQVNTSGEQQKAGVLPKALPELLGAAGEHSDAVRVCGLMCMAPDPDLPGVSAADISSCFQSAASLAQEHAMVGLSMGMSKDLEYAIAAGATAVRIGTELFANHGT